MAEAKKTTSNWSDKEVEQLKARYVAGVNDNDTLAALVAGKSAQMARHKLVNLGLYVKADPVATKAATGKTNKTGLVSAIEILASMPAGSLETLEKASKPQLEALAKRMTDLSNKLAADAGQREPEAAEEVEEVQTSGM